MTQCEQKQDLIRFYPSECCSAYCGRLECSGCHNLPKLIEFQEWRERTAAIQPDPIWSPRCWEATNVY